MFEQFHQGNDERPAPTIGELARSAKTWEGVGEVGRVLADLAADEDFNPLPGARPMPRTPARWQW
jgi:hypothetical protein